MSSFMTFGSRRISVAKHSRSSFALVVVSGVQVRIFLLRPVALMRATSERSRPMRAWFPTGTHRCRLSMEAQSLIGQRVCA
jgi:hypothetical protein